MRYHLILAIATVGLVGSCSDQSPAQDDLFHGRLIGQSPNRYHKVVAYDDRYIPSGLTNMNMVTCYVLSQGDNTAVAMFCVQR